MDASEAREMLYKIEKERKADPSIYIPKLIEPLLQTDELYLSRNKKH